MTEQTQNYDNTQQEDWDLNPHKPTSQEVVVFSFYSSFWEAGQNLKDKDRLAFYDALLNYCFLGEEPQLTGVLAAIFSLARPNIDASNRRRLAGTKGGKVSGKAKEVTSKTSKTKSASTPSTSKEKGKVKGKVEGKVDGKTKEKKKENVSLNQEVQGNREYAPTTTAQTPVRKKRDNNSTPVSFTSEIAPHPVDVSPSTSPTFAPLESSTGWIPQFGNAAPENPYGNLQTQGTQTAEPSQEYLPQFVNQPPQYLYEDFPETSQSTPSAPATFIAAYEDDAPLTFAESAPHSCDSWADFPPPPVDDCTTAPLLSSTYDNVDDPEVDQFIADLQEKLDLAYAPKPKNISAHRNEIFHEYLPLRSGGKYYIPEKILDKWHESYENVDITYHLNRMRDWLNEHPSGTKNAERILDFAERWLGEEEDKQQLSLNKNAQILS